MEQNIIFSLPLDSLIFKFLIGNHRIEDNTFISQPIQIILFCLFMKFREELVDFSGMDIVEYLLSLF
jgi:hypothetical protein